MFGYGLYSLLIYFGLNLYVAQILAHSIGAGFNFIMFRKFVFHSHTPNVQRFIGSYALSYLVGLAFLAGFHRIVSSPYTAGFLAVISVSIVNYFVLKTFVFRRTNRVQ